MQAYACRRSRSTSHRIELLQSFKDHISSQQQQQRNPVWRHLFIAFAYKASLCLLAGEQSLLRSYKGGLASPWAARRLKARMTPILHQSTSMSLHYSVPYELCLTNTCSCRECFARSLRSSNSCKIFRRGHVADAWRMH